MYINANLPASEGSALSTFALPLTPQSTALQKFEFTMAAPGPVADRQDAPHLHETLVDPTGQFVLAPDLGADLVRVFAIDKPSGTLQPCNDYAVTPGNGPRHGAFWTTTTTTTTTHGTASPVLYLTNELADVVTSYAVGYDDDCLTLQPLQVVVPYPSALPSAAAVAEIHLVQDRDLYVSIRYDQGFAPNDSVALLQASHGNGSLAFANLSSAYGTTPRTFVPNKAGTLLAIGDESSSNVAVVRRDAETGVLGELVASLQVGTPGLPGETTGLSSVVWDE
jgi:6-phosphogluconolactonase (cycloisomerase 2 family)